MLKIIHTPSTIVHDEQAKHAIGVYTKRYADALPGINTAAAVTPDTCVSCGGPCWSTESGAYTSRCDRCQRKIGF